MLMGQDLLSTLQQVLSSLMVQTVLLMRRS
jgi:hypothetical protein